MPRVWMLYIDKMKVVAPKAINPRGEGLPSLDHQLVVDVDNLMEPRPTVDERLGKRAGWYRWGYHLG
jgi:hypothetical protein